MLALGPLLPAAIMVPPGRSPRAGRDGPLPRRGRHRAGVLGDVGAAERRSFAVIGDTTNTAARLMTAAEPGDVVGRATWEALDWIAWPVVLGSSTQ